MTVIPGREANPESRDSGFDASHRPGMTTEGLPKSAYPHAETAVFDRSDNATVLTTQRIRPECMA
ncbi:hypothetical protein FFI89_025970 [Bradyrhizobium sp. KBS0727]|nr:hypothetical protein FFI71_025975 [Bradyrhizobium sp. KBS0725]QDW46873.1 hypothetical protein FFI89_025970 [Bradyrhizobium sp. KBS0727]